MTSLPTTDGHRHPFQRAVWLLQHSQPDAVPVGHQGPPGREALRFKPLLGLDFPATEVCQVREHSGAVQGPRYAVETNFFGLYGTPSPLPVSYTEDLIDEEEGGITRGFLDLFNHRLISLFYRAMEKYRFARQFGWDGRDAIGRRLQLLCGVGEETMPERSRLSSLRMLAFAGVLRRRPMSAESLRAVVRAYFTDVDVDVVQCVPQWLSIPVDQRCRLGLGNASLGRDANLGQRVLDRASTFRVVLGPLREKPFLSFLPGAPRLTELRELLDLMNSDQLDYEVELILDPEEEPELRLGSRSAALGWATWLGRPSEALSERGSSVSFLFSEWHHE